MRNARARRGLVHEVIRAVRVAGLGGGPAPATSREAPGPWHAGSTFIRGLSIGALVGAAIAGSTVWERRQRRRKERDAAAVSNPDREDAARS